MKKILYFAFALGIILPHGAPAAMPVSSLPDAGKADERFRSMDTDNTGAVTFEGFQKRYPNMQRPAFDSIDTGKDGAISLEEWRAFFQNHGHSAPKGGVSKMPPPSGGEQSGRPLILPPAR